MTITGVLVTVFVVFVVAALLGGLIATLRQKSWERYLRHRDRFFRLAKKLVNADDAPFEAAIMLRYLGRSLHHPLLPLFLAYASLDRGPAKTSPETEGLLKSLETAPKPVTKLFGSACFHAITAVSYRSIVLGPFIRRSLPSKNKKRDGVQRDFLGRVIQHSERHMNKEDTDPMVCAGLRHAA